VKFQWPDTIQRGIYFQYNNHTSKELDSKPDHQRGFSKSRSKQLASKNEDAAATAVHIEVI
jgi:hypothetical protein